MPVEEGAPTIAGVTFLRRFGPALAIMVVIFVASATPGEDLPDLGILDVRLPVGPDGFALAADLRARGDVPWRDSHGAALTAGYGQALVLAH